MNVFVTMNMLFNNHQFIAERLGTVGFLGAPTPEQQPCVDKVVGSLYCRKASTAEARLRLAYLVILATDQLDPFFVSLQRSPPQLRLSHHPFSSFKDRRLQSETHESELPVHIRANQLYICKIHV